MSAIYTLRRYRLRTKSAGTNSVAVRFHVEPWHGLWVLVIFHACFKRTVSLAALCMPLVLLHRLRAGDICRKFAWSGTKRDSQMIKSDRAFISFFMYVSAWNNSAPSGRILMKFHSRAVFENLANFSTTFL